MEKKNKEKFEFQPKQWVLARDADCEEWTLCQFSHYTEDEMFPYGICGGTSWNKCIPYEGNKHLLGTTDPYVETKSESEYVPKDGDFVAIKVYEGVVTGTNPWICIFKSISDAIDAYAGLGLDGNLVNKGNNVSYNKDWMKHIRPATEGERNQLLSKLRNIGKDWNEEKKEVVDWKWMPKLKERFFQPYFDRNRSLFICGEANWLNTDPQEKLYKNGWAFKKDAEEECKAMCDKLNNAIKNVK